MLPRGATHSSLAHPPRTPLRLHTLAGPELPAIELDPGDRAVIGKDPASRIVLPHPAVSRSHALIEFAGDRWMISDLGSRNGTFLNGERLETQRPLILSHGDHLRIPPWVFRIALTAESDEPQTIDDRSSAGHRLSMIRRNTTTTSSGSASIPALLKAAVAIHQSDSIEDLARAAVEASLALTSFGQAAIIRRTASASRVEVLWSQMRSARASEFAFSRSLVEAALAGSGVYLRAPMELEKSSSIGALEISSAACLPIMLDDAVWGCLYLDCRGRQYVNVETIGELCQVLAELASMALHSILKRDVEARFANLQRDAELAAQAQRLLLPPEHGCIGGLHYALGFKPGRIVSGDLVGVVGLSPTRAAAFVGDVTGKGMAAGLVMAAIQSYLTAALLRSGDLGAAVDELNRYLAQRLTAACYASLWVGLFDAQKRTIEYVDAGHGLAWLARDGTLDTLGNPDNLWLGVAPEQSYTTRKIPLEAGARLLVISDGVVEQPGDDGAHFGAESLARAIRPSTSVRADVDHLIAAVMHHTPGATPRDDITVASFTFDPPPSPA